MELRTILFGYNKHQFEYSVNAEEAKIVKRIFEEYISGRTLLQIGNTLTEEKVVYYRDRTLWSKQAIRRIIENKHYVGDESYPTIIDREMFEKANLLRLEKGGDREKDSEEIHYFKYHTECMRCGARITRKSHYSRQREAWGCVNGCKTTRYLDDDAFLSDILEIVNKAIGNPELLRLPYSDDDLYSPSIRVQRDERTLSDLLQKDTVTFQSAKKVYFDIVTEKFECCKPDNGGAVTETLISYMADCGPIKTVDLNLFKTILDKILVDESGEIALKFINGAVLKKDMEGACDE